MGMEAEITERNNKSSEKAFCPFPYVCSLMGSVDDFN